MNSRVNKGRRSGRSTVEPTDKREDSSATPSAARVRIGTLVALDARLIVELEADNHRLQASFDTGARALTENDHTAAAAAFALCSEDLQRLQWIEALSLFPPLVNRNAVDLAGAARVVAVRDALMTASGVLRTRLDASALSSGADPVAARAALDDYFRIKRTELYPLYQELAERERGG